VEANLDLSQVRKKLAEAGFFLRKCEQEERFFGDKEPFDYYLSAFLSAGRTVDYRLRHEHGTIYKPWRATWDASLTPDENALIEFLIGDPPGMSPTVVNRQTYSFTINGTNRRAIEACAAYLALLQRMVDAFAAANP
jgi:hypothetical protein